MMRVKIFEGGRLTGWDDPDRSRAWGEHTVTVERDGRDVVVGRASGLEMGRETLYRATTGRWVLRRQVVNVVAEDRSRFIGVEQARDWMTRAGYDPVSIATAMGPDPASTTRGLTVSMSGDERARIDRAAETAGLSRSEWIRRRCTEALDTPQAWADAHATLARPAAITDVTRFNAVFTTSLLARIDSAAAAAGLSRSEWIRRRCAEATTDDEH